MKQVWLSNSYLFKLSFRVTTLPEIPDLTGAVCGKILQGSKQPFKSCISNNIWHRPRLYELQDQKTWDFILTLQTKFKIWGKVRTSLHSMNYHKNDSKTTCLLLHSQEYSAGEKYRRVLRKTEGGRALWALWGEKIYINVKNKDFDLAPHTSTRWPWEQVMLWTRVWGTYVLL